MHCYIHSQQEAIGSCVECGHGVCLICLNKVKGRIFCDQCAQKGPTNTALRRMAHDIQNELQIDGLNETLAQLNPLSAEKNRYLAAVLALTLGWGGAHKFYLGQPGWGIAYLLFFWTGIPAMAGWVEALWYLIMTDQQFQQRFYLSQGMMIQRITQVQPVAGVQAPTLGDNRSLSSLPLHSESDYERYILKFASLRQGRISIAQLAAETPISIEKAEKHLARLEGKGYTHAEIDPDTGVIRYLFPEFMYPGLPEPDSGLPY